MAKESTRRHVLMLLADGQEPLSLMATEVARFDVEAHISRIDLLETLDELEAEGFVGATYVGPEWRLGEPFRMPSAGERSAERSRILQRSAKELEEAANSGLFYGLTDSGERLVRSFGVETHDL